jgi:hypothetical protein
METRTLRISGKIPKKEAQILDDYKKVIDIIGKSIAYTDLFENNKSNTNFIVFYIIQASYDFIRSIFDLWVDRGYHSSYILARALVEYYINLVFILKEDSEKRATEFINAYTKETDPFKKTKFKHISNRAKNAGLTENYKKDYASLCSFAHVNLKGSLIARQSEKFKKDKEVFLRNMLLTFTEMLGVISDKMNILYPQDMQELIKEIQSKYNKTYNNALQGT